MEQQHTIKSDQRRTTLRRQQLITITINKRIQQQGEIDSNINYKFNNNNNFKIQQHQITIVKDNN